LGLPAAYLAGLTYSRAGQSEVLEVRELCRQMRVSLNELNNALLTLETQELVRWKCDSADPWDLRSASLVCLWVPGLEPLDRVYDAWGRSTGRPCVSPRPRSTGRPEADR